MTDNIPTYDEIIQTYDNPGDDPQFASFFGFRGDAIPAGQFIIITCPVSHRAYFARTVSSQLNINRDALGQFHNTTINQLEYVSLGKMDRSTVVNETALYKVRILRDVTDGEPRSVRKRPLIASLGRVATPEEAISYLKMPKIDERLIIGNIIDTNIPICFSLSIIMHHVLIAGTTGFGKSNTMANAVAATQEQGACGLLLDHKPDYQNMEMPNNEGNEPYYRGLDNVSYWSLGDSNRPEEAKITVLASELDSTVLAASIFYNPGEVNSFEVLDMLLFNFTEERRNLKETSWTWDEFKAWMPENAEKAKQKIDAKINALTYDTMMSKLRRPVRVPQWIRGKVGGGGRIRDFDLEELIKPGRIIVIRIAPNAGGGRGYALFLSFLLKKIYELKSEGRITCPVATFIDEAQDIFNAGKVFREAAVAMLSENIRKGRSMKIGYVIGVQSADAVPEEILNNLNSQFLHLHNKAAQAAQAMQRASKEQLAMTEDFSPGECLTYMFGSNSVVHCQMRRSPFLLTKND